MEMDQPNAGVLQRAMAQSGCGSVPIRLTATVRNNRTDVARKTEATFNVVGIKIGYGRIPITTDPFNYRPDIVPDPF